MQVAAGRKRKEIGAAGGEKFQTGEVDAEGEAGSGVVRIEAGDAAIDQQAAKRDDEGLQFHPGDQQAVNHSHREADRDHQQGGNRPGDTLIGDQVDKQHAEKGNHRPHRQFDATGNDDQALADGETGELAETLQRLKKENKLLKEKENLVRSKVERLTEKINELSE